MKSQLIHWNDKVKELGRLIKAFELIITFDKDILDVSIDLDKVLNSILDGMKLITSSEYCQILLRRGEKLYIANSTQTEDKNKELDVNKCLAGMVFEKNTSICVGDVHREFPDRYNWMLGKNKDIKMMSQLSIPIYTPTSDRVILGVLNAESPKENAYCQEDIQVAEQFAIQAGVAIHNMHFQDGLKLTLELAKSVQYNYDTPVDTLRHFLDRIKTYFGVDVEVQFLVAKPSCNTLLVECSTVPITEKTNVLISSSFCGLVYNNGLTKRSNNVSEEYKDIFKDTLGDKGSKPTLSELASPIKRNGEIVGVLNIESPNRNAFSEHDEYLISLIALHSGDWMRFIDGNNTKSILALRKMESVKQATANIIHICRNASTSMAHDLSKLNAMVNTNGKAHVKKIDNSIACLVKRIEELEKRFSSMDSEIRRINVNEIVQKIAEEVITREEICVKFMLDNRLDYIVIYPEIKDVFWNLLSNAQKSIDNGKHGIIEIRTKLIIGEYTKEVEGVSIWIKDNGSGIAKENIDKIYQSNYTSKEGGGFGLFFIKIFVDMCQGIIECNSDVGKGTEFNIFFPLTKDRTCLSAQNGGDLCVLD